MFSTVRTSTCLPNRFENSSTKRHTRIGIVFEPVPKRRHVDGKAVVSVQQILAKRSRGDALFEVPGVGR